MNNKYKIAVVVVTHNRLSLLTDAIRSVLNQSYPVENIIVVDNASTDGTFETINAMASSDKKIIYFRLGENTGGAGGFCFGIEKACHLKVDYVWLMDDDVFVEERALEHLINASMIHKAPYYCSSVFSENNQPMNMPEIDDRMGDSGYASWNQFLCESVVKIKSCTFVSVLIDIAAVGEYGLPIKEMFIWGDDGEYTLRLSQKQCGYLAGKSIVRHRRKNQKKIHISYENNKDRLNNFFYFYRNNLYIAKKHKTRIQFFAFIFFSIIDAVKSLSHGNLIAFFIIIKGLWGGLFFEPSIKYVSDILL